MAKYDNIFTNKALEKMTKLSLSESLVMDVFNTGETEASKIGGWNAVKKFSGQEIGVYFIRDERGVYKIVSVWKRERR